MPWDASDAKRHNKKAKGKKARQWAHVANSVLNRTGDEGRAVRSANSVIKRSVIVDVSPLLKTAVEGHQVRLPSGRVAFVQYHQDKRPSGKSKVIDVGREIAKRRGGVQDSPAAQKAITVLLSIANAGVWADVLYQMAHHMVKSARVISLDEALAKSNGHESD